MLGRSDGEYDGSEDGSEDGSLEGKVLDIPLSEVERFNRGYVRSRTGLVRRSFCRILR